MERRGAGLKMPVVLNIKEMPPMLSFEFGLMDVPANGLQETLVGDPEAAHV